MPIDHREGQAEALAMVQQVDLLVRPNVHDARVAVKHSHRLSRLHEREGRPVDIEVLAQATTATTATATTIATAATTTATAATTAATTTATTATTRRRMLFVEVAIGSLGLLQRRVVLVVGVDNCRINRVLQHQDARVGWRLDVYRGSARAFQSFARAFHGLLRALGVLLLDQCHLTKQRPPALALLTRAVVVGAHADGLMG